jgi:hypothetical protein
MNKYEALAIMATMLSMVGIVGALANAWIKTRESRSSGGSSRDLREIAERLTRLEQGMDAVALEVERISEGQRFTSRLLAERGEAERIPRG